MTEMPKTDSLDESIRRDEEIYKNFKETFNRLQDEIHRLCADGGNADTIIKKSESLLILLEDEDLYRCPRDVSAEEYALEETMEGVIVALRSYGKSAADIILWAVGLTYCYSGYCSTDAIRNLIRSPHGEFALPEVWREVAVRLQRQMDNFAEDESGGVHSKMWHLIDTIIKAWRLAGNEMAAAEYMVKYVSRVGNWKETADFLNKHSMHDEAIKIARAGIAASANTSDYGNDYAEIMQEPLADAFSGIGDHAKAAAILAEQFLDWMGCYEYHRSLVSFRKVLCEAEKAGVRDEVESALLQALKTGINPLPLQVYKAELETDEFPWKRLPKRVSYRAYDASPVDPPWPLPRANEGIKLCELRWGTMWEWCQFDQEFLLELDVARGDKDAVARRFCDLPRYPISSSFYQHDVEKMMAQIEEMMKDFRPDIIDVMQNPRTHWSSPQKNPFRHKQ